MDSNAQTAFVQRKACPACHAENYQIVYELPFADKAVKRYLTSFYEKQGGIDYQYLTGGVFSVAECVNCSLMFQTAILNDSLLEMLYEEWIDPKKVFEDEERAFGVDYYARYCQEIASLIAYFRTAPAQLKFLDFGMGWGKWLKLVQGFGVKGVGTELSQSRINYAAKFGIEVISWDQLKDHQFDLVNTEQVFEHLPNPLQTLEQLKMCLKPGGIIKISVPNGNGIRRKLHRLDWSVDKTSRRSFNPISPLEHIIHNDINKCA